MEMSVVDVNGSIHFVLTKKYARSSTIIHRYMLKTISKAQGFPRQNLSQPTLLIDLITIKQGMTTCSLTTSAK